MSETIKTRIMLLVGSNGKVSVCTEGSLDWGDLADNIMDYTTLGGARDPETTARYFVDVDVPVPTVGSLHGTVSPTPQTENKQERE
jgi:hypothetical protein